LHPTCMACGRGMCAWHRDNERGDFTARATGPAGEPQHGRWEGFGLGNGKAGGSGRGASGKAQTPREAREAAAGGRQNGRPPPPQDKRPQGKRRPPARELPGNGLPPLPKLPGRGRAALEIDEDWDHMGAWGEPVPGESDWVDPGVAAPPPRTRVIGTPPPLRRCSPQTPPCLWLHPRLLP
jgi:hypothetical protein